MSYNLRTLLPKVIFSSVLTLLPLYLNKLNASTEKNLLHNSYLAESSINDVNDTIIDKNSEIFKHAVPLDFSSIVFENPGWVGSYDCQHKNPKWVLQHFINQNKRDKDLNIIGKGSFKNDSRLPSIFQLPQKAYVGTGYDRGHIIPASDMKSISAEAYFSSYLFTNISPQNGEFNKGYWKKVENFTRYLVKNQFDSVYVISGPMYLPLLKENGKRIVTYEILESNISVPTHFFKIILAESINKNLETNYYFASFVFPNSKIEANINLENFLVPMDFITLSTGLLFFPSLIKESGDFDKRVKPLCSKVKCTINYLDKFI